MDDLNSSSICAVLNSGDCIAIWESIEKISTAVTHFWIGNGRRVSVLCTFQVSLHGLHWCCMQNVVLCEASGSLRVVWGGESLRPGWLNVDFLFEEEDFAWASGGQRESVMERASEAVISFCYKMGILSPLFQAYPPHTLRQVSWCVNSRRSQVAAEGQWGL